MKQFTLRALLAGLVCGTTLLFASVSAHAATINVPGIADPWLAGAAPGVHASADPNGIEPDDVAPDQSPVEVLNLCLDAGSLLDFEATGNVGHFPSDGGADPNGYLFEVVSHSQGAEHGIADLSAPINSLIGVFLGTSIGAAPAGLNYTDLGNHAPALQQVFYIGSMSQVIVPNGAAHLYLGVMDSYSWNNNRGSFDVRVTNTSCVPEPGSLSLIGAGLTGLLVARRRKAKRV